MLKIYNSLSRNKQTFTPIVPNKVSLYVCGMTVYDYCHLGHARVMVVFDTVNRWFNASGYAVNYVRNITDIDDKIIKRANDNGESIGVLTQRFIDAMDEDFAKLGVQKPAHQPRATQHINGMISMISQLIEKGHAYIAANNDVFYSVRSFADYGHLSGKSVDDLRAGERVEIDSYKRDAMDFVLWKSAKPGEPSWNSPFGGNGGAGRPGWHIECSAMSAYHLGAHFDIHGGGQDLQFPHHENEIAQSEAVNNCKMANYWMHNGFVRVINEKDGHDEKMSKSLGNFFTIRDVLKKYDAEVVRFFILRAHYRSPLNYSDIHLDDAKASLTRLYTALRVFKVSANIIDGKIDWSGPHATRFKLAMDDDFNTVEAMPVLFELANELNKTKDTTTANLLFNLAGVLGLLQQDANAFLQGTNSGVNANVNTVVNVIDSGETTQAVAAAGHNEQSIKTLIALRVDAKKAKNFAEADAIRKQLQDGGIILEDTPQGTTWRRS